MKREAFVVALILEARLRLYSLTSMPEISKLDQYHMEALHTLVG